MKTQFSLITVAIILANTSAFALEALNDSAMSAVNGADGVQVSVRANQATLDSLYLSDNTATATQYQRIDNVYVKPVTTGEQIGADIVYQTGSNISGQPISKLSVNSTPLTFNGSGIKACSSASTTTDCTTLTGATSITLPTGISFSLSALNGFLGNRSNQQVSGQLAFDNASMSLRQTGTDGTTNQIALGDVRANVSFNGQLYVSETEGLRFKGATVFDSVVDTAGYRAGLQATIRHVANSSSANPVTGYITRLGASGSLKNVDFALRGVNDSNGSILGLSGGQSIAGTTGLGLNLKAQYGSDFSYEIGEAGALGRSFRFSELVPFDNPNAGLGVAGLDSGDIYINTIRSDKIALPVSARLNNTIGFNSIEVDPADSNGLNYQSLGSTPVRGTVFAVRGLNLQGMPVRTEVINNRTGAVTKAVTGSFLTLINNGNLNLAWTGMEGRQLGFALGYSSQGLSGNNRSSTVFGLADPTTNLYFGWRNIDMLVKTAGTIDINSDAINFTIPNLLILGTGDVAAGFLMKPTTNFSSDDGVTGNSKADLLGKLRFKLEATDSTFSLLPSDNSSGLAFTGRLNIPRVNGDRMLAGINTGTNPTGRTRQAGSFFHVVEPSDNSVLGFENISGAFTVLGSQGNEPARLDVTNDGLTVESTLLINGTRNSSNVRTWGNQVNDFSIGNINFYPKGDMDSPQRLAEIAMPGGEIYSRITLKLN